MKPLNIEYGAINEQNVEQLRKVNAACFPVSYNDSFYKEVVEQHSDNLSKFAYYQNFVIGAVCCRLENVENDKKRLYIMTLGVLAAYRGRGVGGKLIQSILDYYESVKGDELSTVDEIALHVQISNSDAIHFYTKHFNFVKGDMVMNYYKRIDPPHCYILSKKLR